MKLRRLTEHAINTAHAAEDAVVLALETRTKAQRAAQEYRQAKVRLKAARKVAKATKQEAGETLAAAAIAEKAVKRTRKKAERAAKALVKFKARQKGAKKTAAQPAKEKLAAPDPIATARVTGSDSLPASSRPVPKSPKRSKAPLTDA
ncbi:hypothetical protein LBMAG56_04440 [Verrucomicrobiota bacterium]|nr:hypothetical protein LBMAG56_04440 [Verrucomicrobiota bacterium]